MSTQTKSFAIGVKRWARLSGAATAWSIGGWVVLLSGILLWWSVR